jgi:hypothetical protein
MKSLKKSPGFDLIQERGNGRKVYEGWSVWDFELRCIRSRYAEGYAPIRLKLELRGGKVTEGVSLPAFSDKEKSPGDAPDILYSVNGLRYEIDGTETGGIYGFSIKTRRDGTPKVFVRLHRILGQNELPPVIEKLIITARVRKGGEFGLFKIHLEKLLLAADETTVNSADKVIGPLRYYAAGSITADVFSRYADVV